VCPSATQGVSGDASPPFAAMGVVGLAYSEEDRNHAPPKDGLGREREHIERPERTQAVWNKLEKSGTLLQCMRVPSRELTRDEALLCHTVEHCDALDALEHAPSRMVGAWYGTSGGTQLTGWSRSGLDMYHSGFTPRAARLAAGNAVSLTELVCRGQLRSGFAVVRPPGHHACTDRMCGFCFLNSAAIAARTAVTKHGMNRVLLVDWDVHHGNGTQDIFEEDPRVLYLSLHRMDKMFFPGTGDVNDVGRGAGAGYCVNLPWRHEGMGDAEYLAAFDAIVMPIAQSFNPDLVIVSAGFDAASGDKVGEMNVTPEGFAAMASKLTALANGRAVYVLEGGYKPSTVARCALAVVQVLLSDAREEDERQRRGTEGAKLCGDGSSSGCTSSSHLKARHSAGGDGDDEDWEPGSARRLLRGASRAISDVVRAHACYWPVLQHALARAGLRTSRPSERTSNGSEPDTLCPTEALPEAGAGNEVQGAMRLAATSGACAAREIEALAEPVTSSLAKEKDRAASAFEGDVAEPLERDERDGIDEPISTQRCVDCNRWQVRAAFAPSQLKKKAGARRCKDCVASNSGRLSCGTADGAPVAEPESLPPTMGGLVRSWVGASLEAARRQAVASLAVLAAAEAGHSRSEWRWASPRDDGGTPSTRPCS